VANSRIFLRDASDDFAEDWGKDGVYKKRNGQWIHKLPFFDMWIKINYGTWFPRIMVGQLAFSF
jgi:hypothetical protein